MKIPIVFEPHDAQTMGDMAFFLGMFGVFVLILSLGVVAILTIRR